MQSLRFWLSPRPASRAHARGLCESSGAQLAIGARGGANIKNLILDLRGVSFSIGHANARFYAICANHNSGQLKRLDRVASLF